MKNSKFLLGLILFVSFIISGCNPYPPQVKIVDVKALNIVTNTDSNLKLGIKFIFDTSVSNPYNKRYTDSSSKHFISSYEIKYNLRFEVRNAVVDPNSPITQSKEGKNEVVSVNDIVLKSQFIRSDSNSIDLNSLINKYGHFLENSINVFPKEGEYILVRAGLRIRAYGNDANETGLWSSEFVFYPGQRQPEPYVVDLKVITAPTPDDKTLKIGLKWVFPKEIINNPYNAKYTTNTLDSYIASYDIVYGMFFEGEEASSKYEFNYMPKGSLTLNEQTNYPAITSIGQIKPIQLFHQDVTYFSTHTVSSDYFYKEHLNLKDVKVYIRAVGGTDSVWKHGSWDEILIDKDEIEVAALGTSSLSVKQEKNQINSKNTWR